ncbi:MAG TPA: tripartite tricarboxylate transporter substrate-binding protein [Xanthobacteraceae bacterium]|jgi:tripartite-type tricarboxylate transporter receptor subunit TctC
MKPITLAVLASAFAVSVAATAAAQTPEQFYKGKQIELAIGYPPAGSNDVYARLLARHIGKHIPGNPTVVPQNRPGAGSFLTLGYVYNVAPKDGTVIGIGAPTAPLDEKVGAQGVRFKSAEFNWIGRIDSLVNMVFLWHTSPVKTFADALKTESKLSGTGVGSTVSVYPTVTNNVLGTRFKLIMGYKGSNEAQLAVERGEVEGHSTSWTAVKVAHPDWRPDKKINIVVQYALKRHPEMSDVPTVIEFARTDEQRQVLRAVMNATEIGTAFFTTPGAPADRVEALRRAFDATMKDPEFLAEAVRTKLTLGPLPGEELQKLVNEVTSLSPEMIEKVKAANTMPK